MPHKRAVRSKQIECDNGSLSYDAAGSRDCRAFMTVRMCTIQHTDWPTIGMLHALQRLGQVPALVAQLCVTVEASSIIQKSVSTQTCRLPDSKLMSRRLALYCDESS